jgi:hypothetical protein
MSVEMTTNNLDEAKKIEKDTEDVFPTRSGLEAMISSLFSCPPNQIENFWHLVKAQQTLALRKLGIVLFA